ncbi:hypothetical protein [Cohnella rhizosphaerae]|uniref:Uncharacterized protein n=1 Tax=Cohnella rhizosphaerae TaxID=1457232 RepID=A0A9X4KXU0_9BACL|nr:hypothetical protein [Cohnella rhizosphaerae]MDG0812498.1 hypothetical protein [Cohnella rhizosphaerae]
MKGRSVVFKLFAVTASLVLLLFVLLLLAEGLFFERFYRASKNEAIERSLTAFGKAYRQAEQTKAGSGARLLGDLMNRSDASVALLNERFEFVAVNPYFLKLRADGKTVTVPLASEGMTADALPQGLKIGDRLTIDGIYMDEEDTIMQPIAIGQEKRALEDGLVRVDGTIADLLVPERRSYNPFLSGYENERSVVGVDRQCGTGFDPDDGQRNGENGMDRSMERASLCGLAAACGAGERRGSLFVRHDVSSAGWRSRGYA